MSPGRAGTPRPRPLDRAAAAGGGGAKPGGRAGRALLALAALLVGLSFTADRWLPGLATLLGLLEANGDAIGAVADTTQIVLFVCALVAALLRLLLGFRRPGDAPLPAAASEGEPSGDDRSVSAGRDITGAVITGDNSRVTYELGEGLYERLRSSFRPAPLGAAPPLPEAFVGREEDLSELKRSLGRASEGGGAAVQVLTAVHGWPGVGKTAVAAALAHDEDVRRTFPDGVLFASLGQDPAVLSTIVGWGRALGVGDLSDASTIAEASARLAAALGEKRALLVLDDVWDAAHAAPLAVGGRRCATLVTTRLDMVARELSPRAEGVYRLGVLAEARAVELLGQLAPAVVEGHPGEARALARELDGLPLALRIAGGLLAAEANAGFGVADLLAELRDAKRLLEQGAPASYEPATGEPSPTVDALLRRSTDRLRPLYRKRFALLGVMAPRPVSFDGAAAQSVWDIRSDPRMSLRALVDRGLIEPAGNGRFQMHSLLSAFATSLLDEDPELPGVREAQLRRLRHYEVVLGAADEAFFEGGEVYDYWLANLDANWEGVRAAHAWAASRMDDDREAAEAVEAYAAAGANVLAFRQPPKELVRWMELALRSARRLGDPESIRGRVATLGAAHLIARDYTEAILRSEEALGAAREADDLNTQLAAHGNLAGAHSSLGETDRALRHAEECLRLARELKDSRTEAKATGTLGEIYAELGRPADAVRHLKGQMYLARKIPDGLSEARAMRKLGIFYREYGRLWRAAVLFEAAAARFRNLKDHQTYREVLLSHGVLCLKQGAYSKAEEIFDRVIASAEAHDDLLAKAQATMNKGIAEDELGRPGLAEALHEEAAALAREAEAEGAAGDAHWNRSQALEAQGRPREAVGAARDALAAYRSVGDPKKVEMAETWLDERGAL